MPVCHFCTPEDHTGRNVVCILKVLEVCPNIPVACSDYNSLLCKQCHRLYDAQILYLYQGAMYDNNIVQDARWCLTPLKLTVLNFAAS